MAFYFTWFLLISKQVKVQVPPQVKNFVTLDRGRKRLLLHCFQQFIHLLPEFEDVGVHAENRSIDRLARVWHVWDLPAFLPPRAGIRK